LVCSHHLHDKSFSAASYVVLTSLCFVSSAFAQSDAPADPAAKAAAIAKSDADADKKAAGWVASLKLGDPAREAAFKP